MQRYMPIVLLFLALLSGGIAAYMASGWLQARSHQTRAPGVAMEMVQVVTAAKEIIPGATLNGENIKLSEWPKDKVIPGIMSDLKAAEGRVTRNHLYPGEVIIENRLAPKGTPGGMAGIIQDNTRAVTIKVDEASGVAGFIMPGNRVDVLLTMDRKKFDEDPVTQTALQNLLVLGKGQEIEQKDGEKPKVVPTVTLQVTPEEGERLALAAKEGHITLALRGWSESASVATSGVKASELLRPAQKTESAFETPIAPPSEPPKKAGVEVLRGTEREVVTF